MALVSALRAGGLVLIMRRLKSLLPRSLKRQARRTLRSLRESAAYLVSRSGAASGKVSHVVFVCKGNICRSAFAEHYLARALPDLVLVESCGLDVDQGDVSPPEAILAGREFGLNLEGHRSQGMEGCNLQGADLIVPMEYPQYRRLLEVFPDQKERIRLLRDFAPRPARWLCNIYDPFGLGPAEFRRCFRSMQAALDGLTVHLQGLDPQDRGGGSGGSA